MGIALRTDRTTDWSGLIDDEIRQLLVENVKAEDVTLFAIFDSCHSQTIMDLPYEYLPETGKFAHAREVWVPQFWPYPEELPNFAPRLRVICLSGCKDNGYSMGGTDGLLTRTFFNNFKDGNATLHDTFEKVRSRWGVGWFQTPYIHTLNDDPDAMQKTFNQLLPCKEDRG